MKPARIAVPLCALVVALPHAARADDPPQFPRSPSFTTLIATPLAIEGLTGDADGNLYSTGRAALGTPCPVWRINSANPSRVQIGSIPNAPTACNPSGITFDAFGNLYIADANFGGTIWKLTRKAGGFASPATSSDAFASGVPGTNGIAFDRDGNLWTGDGTTGQGRVWRIAPAGGVCGPAAARTGCSEVFRIQPMANGANVGRQVSTLQPPPAAANPQPLVANGVAFDHQGNLYVADTARGAIWKAQFDRRGELQSATNCDSTFSANALCLDNIFVAHPYLEGADGIALDRAGNIWVAANERNAIVAVTKDGRVAEVFRNPVNTAGLRNAADTPAGNAHVLEFPTSPFLLGKKLCTANSDGNRRDNSPNSAGEVNQGGTGNRSKISCMDQELTIPGLPLPVQ